MFNYSSEVNEGRLGSSNQLERVESGMASTFNSPSRKGNSVLKLISHFPHVIGGLLAGGIILAASAIEGAKAAKNQHSNSGDSTGGDGDLGRRGVPSSDGDSGQSAPAESGSYAGGGSGGSKLRPKSRLDAVADGIVPV